MCCKKDGKIQVEIITEYHLAYNLIGFSRMVKKKTHIDFCHELKAQNLKVTVLGTYKDYNSKIAVKCDKCGCEWSPRAGSLLHGHGCPRCAGVKLKSHAEFVKDLKSLRDDVIITGRYVKALEKN